MADREFYYTIDKTAVAEFKDRGSRFIAHAYPIQSTEDFKNNLQYLRKEHPKAVHYCFAYRLGLDGNNFRVSDDGEPGGTAGKPILGQIDSRQLTNVLVFVARYFGGTLLGVPGLINAYKSAAIMVLQETPVVRKVVEANYHLHFDYTQMNQIMILIKKCNCNIIEREAQLFCNMKVGVPVNRLEEFLYKINDLSGVELIKV